MARCLSPIWVKDPNKKDVKYQVPCSGCLDCKKRRISEWSFRLCQEARAATSAFFVTLTYDTKFVPISSTGCLTFDKRHVQLFVKRLRKKVGNSGIKYYLCAEYGAKIMRPHYHMLLFNVELQALIGSRWAKFVTYSPAVFLNGRFRFSSELWQYGHITIGSVTEKSVGYVLKYLEKPKISDAEDRHREFTLMSKGLGKAYLTQVNVKWHKDWLTERYYTPLSDGKKGSLARYYKQKMYNESERAIISLSTVQKEIDLNQTMSDNDFKIRREKRDKMLVNNIIKMKKNLKLNIKL